MEDIAKTLIMVGALLMAVGGIVYLFGKIPGVGRLPGDILIKREYFTLYFPIVTSLLISLVLTLLLYFFRQR